MTENDTSAPTDGRTLRSVKNKERIIAAAFRLCKRGNLWPTVQQVADEAELGLRTVFRLFNDVDNLYASFNQHLHSHYERAFREGNREGPLPKRLKNLVEHRCNLYQELDPFFRSTMATEWRIPVALRQYRETVREWDEDIHQWLPELSSFAPERRDAVYLALSFENWNRLTRYMERSPSQARKSILANVQMLIG